MLSMERSCFKNSWPRAQLKGERKIFLPSQPTRVWGSREGRARQSEDFGVVCAWPRVTPDRLEEESSNLSVSDILILIDERFS